MIVLLHNKNALFVKSFSLRRCMNRLSRKKESAAVVVVVVVSCVLDMNNYNSSWKEGRNFFLFVGAI